jgi:hypothetical protein
MAAAPRHATAHHNYHTQASAAVWFFEDLQHAATQPKLVSSFARHGLPKVSRPKKSSYFLRKHNVSVIQRRSKSSRE